MFGHENRTDFCPLQEPRGNADTERTVRMIKHDFVWVREFRLLARFIEQFGLWVERYNTDLRYSTIGYCTTCTFEKK